MEIKQIAYSLKAMSDPTRIKLLDLIRKGTQCNCEFCESLDLQPNLVSHHLHILKKAGMVNIEKDPLDSRWIYYSINQETFRELREILANFLDPANIQPRASTCGPSCLISTLAEKVIFPEN